jgi:hypothetical protein
MSNDRNVSGSATKLPAEHTDDDDAARRLREIQDEEHMKLINRQLNMVLIILGIMGLCFFAAAESLQAIFNSLH